MANCKLFWKGHSPFSNWYMADFKLENIRFNCVEQYMMYKKAMLFDDIETAKKILETEKPVQQKALGRQTKGFNIDIWLAHSYQIVYEGCKAKFAQNPKLIELLLATGTKILAEASPTDLVWGTGVAAHEKNARNPEKWPGKNRLGRILMQIREELLKLN